MGARKKGRSRFDYKGRDFFWRFDDTWIHVCSSEKGYAVSYLGVIDSWMKTPLNQSVLKVSGPDFCGLEHVRDRPVFVVPPLSIYAAWAKSIGCVVNEILCWSFAPKGELSPIEWMSK
ncbi:MAG: hypothetical protein AAF532_16665 [Planctomycetota bacterium]